VSVAVVAVAAVGSSSSSVRSVSGAAVAAVSAAVRTAVAVAAAVGSSSCLESTSQHCALPLLCTLLCSSTVGALSSMLNTLLLLVSICVYYLQCVCSAHAAAGEHLYCNLEAREHLQYSVKVVSTQHLQ
jgi:hypothetical protein